MPDIASIISGPAMTQAIERAKEVGVQHQRIRKATREMESYFVGMLMKKMHESTFSSGLFSEKPEMATFREMFDDSVAHEIGSHGAFGIADMLYRELVGHTGQSSK